MTEGRKLMCLLLVFAATVACAPAARKPAATSAVSRDRVEAIARAYAERQNYWAPDYFMSVRRFEAWSDFVRFAGLEFPTHAPIRAVIGEQRPFWHVAVASGWPPEAGLGGMWIFIDEAGVVVAHG